VTPTPAPWSQEPLCDLRHVEALRLAAAAPFGVAVRVRTGVVDRLLVAQTLVPRALRLLVLAGQHEPTADSPCPLAAAHRTGAAVDLTAHVDGLPEPDPWSADPPPDWPLLEAALRAVGMVGTAAWWHWSFGDGDRQPHTSPG
jgi:zinc D-Ala-D-Ala dipeptidase